jgi:6,7-dimethyl-8-ribityllumazine synthase
VSRFLIVEARFYDHLNDMLIAGARAAESGRYDGFVALGVVIRGETYHFEIVAGESARGIMALTMDGLAIGNGILTVENEAQAIARADLGQLNKGAGAAEAAMALLKIREKFA